LDLYILSNILTSSEKFTYFLLSNILTSSEKFFIKNLKNATQTRIQLRIQIRIQIRVMIENIESDSLKEFFHAFYFTGNYIISTSPIWFIFMLLVDIKSSTFLLLGSLINIVLWNFVPMVTNNVLKWGLITISIFISMVGLKLMLNPFCQFTTMMKKEIKLFTREVISMRQQLNTKNKERKCQDSTKQQQVCVICLDEISTVLLVHGDTAHKVLCLTCSNKKKFTNCVICGMKVTNVIRKIYT